MIINPLPGFKKPAHGLMGLMPQQDESEDQPAQNMENALQKRRDQLMKTTKNKVANLSQPYQKVTDN